MTLGSALLRTRLSRGLSNSQLARLAALEPARVSHYEADTRCPSVEVLGRLADALEISVDALLGRREPESCGPLTEDLRRRLAGLTTAEMATVSDLVDVLAKRAAPAAAGMSAGERALRHRLGRPA